MHYLKRILQTVNHHVMNYCMMNITKCYILIFENVHAGKINCFILDISLT